MLCHLQLKDPKRYSKTKNKPPPQKKLWCYNPTISAGVWHSCILPFLSLLPVSLLDQQGRQRSEECCSKERRGGKEGRHQWKGNRPGAEQNRTGQAGGLKGWRMNADEQKPCSVPSLRATGQKRRDRVWITEKKEPQIQIWAAPIIVIFPCSLAQIHLAASDSS